MKRISLMPFYFRLKFLPIIIVGLLLGFSLHAAPPSPKAPKTPIVDSAINHVQNALNYIKQAENAIHKQKIPLAVSMAHSAQDQVKLGIQACTHYPALNPLNQEHMQKALHELVIATDHIKRRNPNLPVVLRHLDIARIELENAKHINVPPPLPPPLPKGK